MSNETWRKGNPYVDLLILQHQRIVPFKTKHFDNLITDTLKLLNKYTDAYVFSKEHVKEVQKVYPSLHCEEISKGIYRLRRPKKGE